MNTTNTPATMPSLNVHQPDTFPFQIELRDAAGTVVQTMHRAAFCSSDKTLIDVLTGRNQSQEWRGTAIELNRKQLAAAYLEAAGPELLAALQGMLAIWPYSECNETRAAAAAIAKATWSAA